MDPLNPAHLARHLGIVIFLVRIYIGLFIPAIGLSTLSSGRFNVFDFRNKTGLVFLPNGVVSPVAECI